jgi:hypothetical protein
MLLIKYFHVRQSKWLNCYASLVLSGLVLAWWSFRVFVVLDEEARHHQVKFAFELFAKKNCFRAFRSFCLCSFFTRMMLWRLFTAPLSLSLQCYNDVCFQKSSCTATSYRSVAISLLGIPFHALWSGSLKVIGHHSCCQLAGGQVSMREPLPCATFSLRDQRHQATVHPRHKPSWKRGISRQKLGAGKTFWATAQALAKSCTHY